MKKISILPLFVLLMCINGISQTPALADRYNMMLNFRYSKVINTKAFNLHVQAHWFADSSGLWFIKHAPGVKTYRELNFNDFRDTLLFDHQKVASLLSDSLNKKVNADSLPIRTITRKSKHELLLGISEEHFLLNTQTYQLSKAKKKNKKPEIKNEKASPDSNWIALSKDYNLFIKSANGDEEKQLSTAGEKGYEYASWYGWADIMEGENGERPEHFTVNWSDDSKWIYANICDLRTANKMYLLNWSIDTLYRPQLLSYYRGSPGDTGMVYMHPVFFNVETGKEIRPDLPPCTHINSIDVQWSDTPGMAYLFYQERGYKRISLYTFNLNTGELDELYTETSATNVEKFHYHILEDHKQILFLSEKDGWRQLYSLNLKNKKLKPLTEGGYYIQNIERIDEENGQVYFLAQGREKGANPYHQRLYKVSFKGGDVQLLTPENRHHNIQFSKDGKYFIDNYSTLSDPTVTVLRSAENGEIKAALCKATLHGLNNWEAPETFTATARDGKTTIYGALWKPTYFDANEKYPIIEYSYTGPHTQVYPKEFIQAFYSQHLAELGFIVVKIDGLGSAGRSKAFHNYSYKNLGGNLADHILAMQQLAARYPWLDTSRVGIYGHSAGGYDAGRAVLEYPGFYKVAVASSADHDHRMEKAWWPEMYMGWPVDTAYHNQSNITMAGNLKGKLLLVHGGIDENVNPSATFKLAEALIKADKLFDMLILPSQRHGYKGAHSTYFMKRRMNYFIEHLRGEEPIWELDM